METVLAVCKWICKTNIHTDRRTKFPYSITKHIWYDIWLKNILILFLYISRSKIPVHGKAGSILLQDFPEENMKVHLLCTSTMSNTSCMPYNYLYFRWNLWDTAGGLKDLILPPFPLGSFWIMLSSDFAFMIQFLSTYLDSYQVSFRTPTDREADSL